MRWNGYNTTMSSATSTKSNKCYSFVMKTLRLWSGQKKEWNKSAVRMLFIIIIERQQHTYTTTTTTMRLKKMNRYIGSLLGGFQFKVHVHSMIFIDECEINGKQHTHTARQCDFYYTSSHLQIQFNEHNGVDTDRRRWWRFFPLEDVSTTTL